MGKSMDLFAKSHGHTLGSLHRAGWQVDFPPPTQLVQSDGRRWHGRILHWAGGSEGPACGPPSLASTGQLCSHLFTVSTCMRGFTQKKDSV